MADWRELLKQTPEKRFDYRLLEKKIEEGFITQAEADEFMKKIQTEDDYSFSEFESIMAETAEEAAANS